MRRKIWFYLCFTAILLLGLWLRGRDLAASAPSGDEGESSINGLTILQHGVPTGTYLGLPIYENCLTEPWPESSEYEFRDSSYSKKNLAIYHGWLPLYSIALSQKLFGVTPDEPQPQPLSVRHDEREVHRRVIAARAPAVVFGGFFMIFLFLAARQMFGADAGMAAMLVGAVGRPFVYMAREARYHSATLALTTAAVWAMWRVYRFGRWRDYLTLAIVIVLLFYTHILAFMIACAMVVPLLPAMLKRERGIAKLLTLGVLIAISIVPWLVLTGFLEQRTHIPPAWKYLSFPADLIYYPIVRIPYLLLPLACFVWLVIVITFHERLPRALTRPLDRHHRQIAFLLAWIAAGILAFTFLVPAASYFYKRLTLPVMGPGVVWGAILYAAAARAWARRRSMIIAPIAFLGTITIGNMSHLWFLEAPDANEAYDMVIRLRALKIHPATKLYCTPNHQLELQYMTGLPIQSIAPIRKSFLDSYPGPLAIIDSSPPYVLMSYDEIEQAVRGGGGSRGQDITRDEIEHYYPVLTTRAQRELLAPRVAWLWPPLDDHPLPYEHAVADFQRAMTRKNLADFEREGCNNPLLRGFHLRDWSDWWPIFFYRFVNPERRMREQLNYADRIKSARTEVRPTAWAIYFCPPLPAPASSTQPAR